MKALPLNEAVAFYLESRRRLGFALESEGALLDNLVAYAREHHHRGPLTTELALDWAQGPPPPPSRQRARRLVAVRHFALFWAPFDPRTQIPPAGLFGSAYAPRRPVHIYTDPEITALLTAAQQHFPAESLNARTFPTLLGLLACTGLRLSEALHLQLPDWDSTEAVLTIRQSKGGQSRYVPLAPSAATALKAYVQVRTEDFPPAPDAALLVDEQGQALRYGLVHRTFALWRTQLGWNQKQPRPRLHDLRHSLAVHCLLGWYRQGQESLQTHILSLAVYLGHRHIRHTYWYLTAVPELLALASARRAPERARQKGGPHE
jgi:integrase/recombinase XerD